MGQNFIRQKQISCKTEITTRCGIYNKQTKRRVTKVSCRWFHLNFFYYDCNLIRDKWVSGFNGRIITRNRCGVIITHVNNFHNNQ